MIAAIPQLVRALLTAASLPVNVLKSPKSSFLAVSTTKPTMALSWFIFSATISAPTARNSAQTTATSHTRDAIRERTALAPATTLVPVPRSRLLPVAGAFFSWAGFAGAGARFSCTGAFALASVAGSLDSAAVVAGFSAAGFSASVTGSPSGEYVAGQPTRRRGLPPLELSAPRSVLHERPHAGGAVLGAEQGCELHPL